MRLDQNMKLLLLLAGGVLAWYGWQRAKTAGAALAAALNKGHA